MNQFMRITKDALARHGTTSTYKTVTEGSYDIATGTAANTETSHSLKIYKKHLKANQYNYPNLIDKDIAMFYFCADGILFLPKPQDLIVHASITYKVHALQSHEANGETILYKVIGVKQ